MTVGRNIFSPGWRTRPPPPDRGRDHVAAFELAVAYLVAGALQPGDDPAAAAVDREPPVPGAVRDEDARRARLAGRCKEPRREGEHVREEVAVGQPEREGVGGSVGVASHAEALRIDLAACEGVPQRPVDGRDVLTVAPTCEDQIPGGPARAGREQDEPRLVYLSPQLRDTVSRVLPCAVQQEDQRGRRLLSVAGGDVEGAVRGGAGFGSRHVQSDRSRLHGCPHRTLAQTPLLVWL